MYLDTSVLVKLYVNEPDSLECDAIARGETLVSSELAHGELLSALLARERGRMISARERCDAWERFLDDNGAGRIHLLVLNGIVVRDASELMESLHPQIPLRTLDAIHLASYASVDAGPLFTKDKRMLAAARKMNFPLATAKTAN